MQPTLLLLITILLTHFIQSTLGGSITASLAIPNRVINSATTYTFTMNLATKITDACIINFVFPSSSGIILPTTPTCTKGTGFNSNPTCTKTSSTTIQLTCSSGMINSLTFPVYSVTINNVINPGSAKTLSNLQILTYTGTTLLDSTNSVYSYYTSVALASSKGSVSTATPTVGAYSIFTAKLTIGNPVPSSGEIILAFPKWETYSLGAVNPGSMISNLVSCSVASDIEGNSPTCSGSISTSATGVDTVTITDAFSTTGSLAAGKTLSVSVTYIRNPPTLNPVTSFAISTADSNGFLIETCSGLTLTLTTLGTLDSSTIIKLEGNTGIGQLGTYWFYIKTTNPIPIGGYVQITLPSQLTANPSTIVFTSIAQIDSGATITKISTTKFNIVNGFPLATKYVGADYVIVFTLSNIYNPSTSYPTSSFAITTYDQASYGIETLTTGLTVQAAAGTLSNVLIYPYDYTGILQFATVYIVTFKTQNPLDTTATIVISFPAASFEMKSGTCTITGLNSKYTCSYDRITQIVTITNFLDTSLSAGSTVKFSISNIYIRNPPTTRASSAISIYTTAQSNKMDSYSSATVTAIPVTISSGSVTSSSQVSYAQGTSFLFRLNVPSYILKGALIYVKVPDDIQIYKASEIINCNSYPHTGFAYSPISCSTTMMLGTTSTYITINNGFQNSSSTTDGPTLTFTLPQMVNPRSTAPSSNFQVFIYDQVTTYQLYNMTSGLTVQVNQPSTMNGLSATASNKTNGITTSYNWQVSLKSYAYSGDYLILNLPVNGNMTFNSNGQTPICLGVTSLLYPTLTCSLINSTSLKVTLNILGRRILTTNNNPHRNLATQLSSFQFSTSNVLNPPSLKLTNSVQMTLYTSGGYIAEQIVSGVTIQNKLPSILQANQVLIVPQNMNNSAISPYIVSFTPTNYQANMILTIQLPTEILMSGTTPNCTAISGVSSSIDCSSYNSTSKTIQVTKAFSSSVAPSTTIQFLISSFINPSTTIQTQSFVVSSYTSDGYQMDTISSGVTINFLCSLPCKSCVTGSNKACSACYSDNTTLLPYLYNEYCYSECPTSYYKDSTNQCIKCASSTCLSCSGPSIGECIGCAAGTSLANGKCIKDFTSIYFFPFLIASILWLISVFFVMATHPPTQYIASAIAGLSICEYILTLFQLGVYSYFNYQSTLAATLIVGLITLYLVNIVLATLYFVILRKQQFILKHKKQHPKSHIIMLICSVMFTNRLYKYIYSSFADKNEVSLNQIVTIKKPKTVVMVVSYLSLIPTVGMIIISAANIAQIKGESGSSQQMFTRNVDIERIIISSIIALLIIVEFISCCTRRPAIVRRLIDEEQHYSASKVQNKKRTYESQEQEEEDNSGVSKKKAMKKLLVFNSMKAQLTNDETFIVGDTSNVSLMNQHRRRLSDPPKYHKENIKSVHYLSERKKSKKQIQNASFMTKSGLLGDVDSDHRVSDGEEKSALSYPLTPKRRNMYNNKMGDQSTSIIRHNNNSMTNFMNEDSFRALKQKKTVEKHNEIKTMMQQIAQEKKQVEQLNEQLKQQRLLLEQEKEEIIKIQMNGSQTTRVKNNEEDLEQVNNRGARTSRSIQKDMASGDEENKKSSHKTKLSRTLTVENRLSRSTSPVKNDKLSKTLSNMSSSQKGFSKVSSPNKSSLNSSLRKRGLRSTSKKNLDEVRESQSELLDDMDIVRRGRGTDRNQSSNKKKKTMSNDRSEVNLSSKKKLEMSAKSKASIKRSMVQSQRDLHEDFSRSSLSPHKCHGHSKETIKSVRKLRSKGSNNTSLAGSKYPSRNQLADIVSNSSPVTKTKPQQNLLRKFTNTKVYYSDKSESSVDDLMDETPSNYNIANGRLEGNSVGLRHALKKDSPSKFSNIMLGTNNHNESNHSLKPKIKNKFRIPPQYKDQDITNINQNDHSFLNESGFVDDSAEQPFGITNMHEISGIMNESRNFNGQPFYGVNDYNQSHMVNQTAEDIQEMVNKKNKKAIKNKTNRNNITLNSSEQSHRTTSFNPGRIKALEVAYLTKLVPNKSTSKLTSQNGTHTKLPKIAVDVRHDNYTPDVASKQMGQSHGGRFAKINNYQD